MYAQQLTNTVALSLQNVWVLFTAFIVNFVVALIVFVFGLVVASILGTFIEKIFEALKLDNFLENVGLKPYFERAGLRLRGARFLGQLVNWFLIIAFLLAASDLLGLTAFSSFLQQVLSYLPNVVVAALIMLAAVVVANFLSRTVKASVLSAKFHAAHFLAAIVWWAVVIFGFLSALVQLQVAVTVIQSLITGFIAMLALAGGLAFGLGGKDYAHHLLEKLEKQTESR